MGQMFTGKGPPSAAILAAVCLASCSANDAGGPGRGGASTASAATTGGATSSGTNGGSSGSGTAGSGTGGGGGASTTSGGPGGGSSTSSGMGGSGMGGSSATGAGGAAGSAGGAGGSAGSGMGGAAGSGMGGAGGAGMGGGPGSIVDPQCLDGKVYAAEVLPVRTDISDLMGTFTVANRLPWVIQVLNRRLPMGALFVSTATMSMANGDGNCFGVSFDANSNTAQKTVEGLRTVVHECGHMMDMVRNRFMMRLDLEYKCSLRLTDGSPPRNIITMDEFDALGPKGGTLDFQKQVYLPPGASGMQNWTGLFTEFNQYVNTLVTSYAYYDHAPNDVIAGDASRDFAWFVERYLRILRTKFKPEYDKLANDTCWRQLILADWGRVNRYWYETTKANLSKLWTAESPKVEKLLQDPVLIAEIENLRVLDGCR